MFTNLSERQPEVDVEKPTRTHDIKTMQTITLVAVIFFMQGHYRKQHLACAN